MAVKKSEVVERVRKENNALIKNMREHIDWDLKAWKGGSLIVEWSPGHSNLAAEDLAKEYEAAGWVVELERNPETRKITKLIFS